ncbi:hypothetical protein PSACC_00379 [Paramicrosporidium saccamoebae]|uniref:Uncharacterized protein n=1 Tax=Paramicrosporidium saccamoebae TaxID=1246581 RepID=A0A2H9TPU0_9FUNG|nr:hypothetical protein PSACC_00379 [Paramicrosporidium saccamoebae]
MKIITILAGIFGSMVAASNFGGSSFNSGSQPNQSSQTNQANQQNRQVPGRLPLKMRDITLPHQFTLDEMEAIRARLRAFSLELQTFAAASRMMSQNQLQMNYAQAIWPIMQCMMSNQDGVCPSGQ